jgi:hypothetical protein
MRSGYLRNESLWRYRYANLLILKSRVDYLDGFNVFTKYIDAAVLFLHLKLLIKSFIETVCLNISNDRR